MLQVFEYLTVGERTYLQTLNREALKAARDLNYQYVQQNRILATFLLSQEEKIFEYDHFICIVCKKLFVNPRYRGSFSSCECDICDVKWCFECDERIYRNKIENTNLKVYSGLSGSTIKYDYFVTMHNH